MERDREILNGNQSGNISIHALRMERDVTYNSPHCFPTNFNPRAPHGARQGDFEWQSIWQHFNPRAPHGARRWTGRRMVLTMSISIHALRMERDAWLSRSSLSSHQFQSTRSAWSATLLPKENAFRDTFQSTRSAWSATAQFYPIFAAIAISIHALRMERDQVSVMGFCGLSDFNPRAPHGARRSKFIGNNKTSHFNPRAPHGARRGQDVYRPRLLDFNPRAPHGARRYIRDPARLGHRNFNPRAPHGARRYESRISGILPRFQSTRSAWSATRNEND